MKQNLPKDVCQKHFNNLCDSVTRILEGQGLKTGVLKPVHSYQITGESFTEQNPIFYSTICYDNDKYAKVCYEYTDENPFIKYVETGLTSNDLEIDVSNHSNSLDYSNCEHSKKQKENDTNLNYVEHKMNGLKDEKLNIVIPPSNKPHEYKNPKLLRHFLVIFICALLLLLGMAIAIIILILRPDTVNPCNKNTCSNGGTCVEDGGLYQCRCRNGYYGSYCQINQCSNNLCKNGGICKINGMNFFCECSSNYTGPYCEDLIPIKPCYINKCLNGGDCKVNGTGFQCVCPACYSDSFCQTYDPCCVNPCSNDGICQPSGNNYVCICPQFYTGKECQTYTNPCLSNPCYNGGQCKLSGNNYVCICPKGYSGISCLTFCNSKCI